MKVTRRMFLNGLASGAITVAFFAGCKTGQKPKASASKKTLPWREAFDIATDAYIFGYPLIAMDLTRRVMTNVGEPDGMHAPMGQFALGRTFPLASNHEVAVPNADTLHAIIWLDVSRQPWVISLPDMQDRYCLFPMLDGWSTVFESLGSRTTGTGPQKFVISGPGWKGKLPAGLKHYQSPTGLVWVLGRIYCTGTPPDYAAVHALQDKCSAMPLSAYGKPYAPPPGPVDPNINISKPIREQINQADAASYFNRLAELMKDNPPTPADARIVKRMARLGIVPGRPFNLNKLDAATIQIFQNVPKAALDKIMARFNERVKVADPAAWNGWTIPRKTGVYGTDFVQRAMIAAVALGANQPQDTMYAISTVDGAGKPYSGGRSYVMHFAPGQAPSADGFWSLTMYDGDYFFVDNPLGRYSLSARDELKRNLDGSLDLYLQRHPPSADWESNWLPAPDGKFILMLRFYWPKSNLISGSWKIPPVMPVD